MSSLLRRVSTTCMVIGVTTSGWAQALVDMRDAIRQTSGAVVQVIQKQATGGESRLGSRLPRLGRRDAFELGFSQSRSGEAIASGTVIGSEGRVLTVLSQQPSGEIAVISADGDKHAATVIAFDEAIGCAILQVKDLESSVLSLADHPVEPGLPIAAVWSRGARSPVVGQGIVATSPSVNEASLTVFETNIPVESEASGGAVIDASGKCVGLLFAASGRNLAANFSTAIPISALQPLLSKIDATEPVTLKAGGLGIQLAAEESIVQNVVEGSAAKKAGIEANDRILRVADQEVTTAFDVVTAVRTFRAGDTIELLVKRGDEERKILVTLDAINRDSTPLGEVLSELPGVGVATQYLDPGQLQELMKNYRGLVPQFVPPPIDAPQSPRAVPGVVQPPRLQVERSNLEESIRKLREDIDKLRDELKEP